MTQIITYPDERLAKKSAAVVSFGLETRLTAERLASYLELNGCLGVAAPQIGHNVRIIALWMGETRGVLVVVNPEIQYSDGETKEEEGCLSIPGVYLKVCRPKKIVLTGQNVSGEEIRFVADGLLARAVAHEIDHLDGVLIWDRLTTRRRVGAIKLFLDFAPAGS